MGYYQGDYYRGDNGALAEIVGEDNPISQSGALARSLGQKLGSAIRGAVSPSGELAAPGTSGRKFTRHELATGVEESGGRHRGPRMNVLNIHAARRAIRRLKGFVKVARKAYNFAGPKSRFKHHRRKRS